MWIETEGSHRMILDANKLDTIYVSYKGAGQYAVIGTIGSRDICIKVLGTEKDATDFLEALKGKLE